MPHTGLMSDALRTGGNVIPTSDPYRTAPYNTSFTHVSNANTEIASATVFNNQASSNDDIVDWVFLELRNTASPGNTVLQTRSAFIQRDGDIVDIDGVSPVTFNNVTNGSYTIAVRHRNHLGLATLPASARTFSETKSIAFSTNVADLRSTGTSLYGDGTNYTTASHPALANVNLLWGGNANVNTRTSYINLSNDKDYILVTLLGNNPSSTILTNVYSAGDVNMNKSVRYINLNNDKDFILVNVLGNNASISRTQSLPQ